MKRGFTVVELIVSFSLVMVIVIFLFQIVIGLKNLYTNSELKTDLLNVQSLVSNEINKKIIDKEIIAINKCGAYCVEFLYYDNTSDKLIIDYNSNTIQFGNYKTKLPEKSYIKDARISKANAATFQSYADNAIIIIEIPIYNDAFKEQNFGVKVIYQYNDNLDNFIVADLTPSTEISYKLENMIKNASFENDSAWTLSGASYSTTYKNSGDRSLMLQASTTAMSQQQLSETAPTYGHIYYGRLMFLSTNNYTNSDNRYEWFYTDAAGAQLVFANKNISTNTWTSISNRVTLPNSSYLDKNWIIRNFTVSANSASYVDDLLLIDLTEAFGSGNEPDKEWCDENIPFFEGTIYVAK